MPTKQDLEDKIELYKAQVRLLEDSITRERADKENLQEQVMRLQDGLLSTKAPEAYRDMVMDRQEDVTPTDETRNRYHEKLEIGNAFMRSIEEPTFRDAVEMIDSLESTILGQSDPTPESIHQNNES